MKKIIYIPILVFIFLVLGFFKDFFLNSKLPIPADTIIGLYHPFRDLYAKDYPNGIPFKNSLITDPVRQQYPWRELAVSLEKKIQFPIWNPYSLSGTPLLANFQTASFYPFNILFFLLPFYISWSILIILQIILSGIFMFLYLKNLKISNLISFAGAFVFSFCGFNIAWMEWGTVVNTALWLPLILLSIDKLVVIGRHKALSIWTIIFFISLSASLFAGHLQTFFYLILVSGAYFFARWVQFGKQKNILILFLILNLLLVIITSVQWIPTLMFISESARGLDQADWQKEGWFIPWQHLIQFIAPDFFGNPTTLNYWGVWNYGEFVGYVGILPLIMAIYAIFFRPDKKTLFFGILLFLSLIFSLPTFFAKIPFILNIPFLSTSQPTRLLFLTDFYLVVLFALGFDYFLKVKKRIIFPLVFIGLLFLFLWLFILILNSFFGQIPLESIETAKRNLYLPTIIFLITLFILLIFSKVSKINKNIPIYLTIALIVLTCFDLLRFADKFTPLIQKEYLFPSTEVISFLQNQKGIFRIMTTDSRILPPNFSVIYRLQSVDGYDPLYLNRYAELIAASERGKPDIQPPFGFNRIITPQNYNSKIMDILGVRYVFSLSDIESEKLTKVFQEGQTRVYENKNFIPRLFFVEEIEKIKEENKQKAIEAIFSKDFDFRKKAVVEGFSDIDTQEFISLPLRIGVIKIINYSENKIIIQTENQGHGFLVLTDSFYPTWHAIIDGVKTKIYRTNYNFRGIFVPKGKHTIEFFVNLI